MADPRMNIYDDQENRVPGVGLKHKRDGMRPLQLNGPQRSAFGDLSTSQSNNTNIRRQPTRSAKQGVSYDGGVPKYSQDENAYARPAKSFGTSGTLASFEIYSDDSANRSGTGCSSSSTVSSFCSNSSAASAVSSTTNASLDGALAKRDTNSLQYAASKLQDMELPHCPPQFRPVVSSSSDLMELCTPDEDCNMSYVSPAALTDQKQHPGLTESNQPDQKLVAGLSLSCVSQSTRSVVRPEQELLHMREERMWDMSEYAADIYLYLREAEKVHRPRVNYMIKQTDISVSMRWILVDWMVEVAEEYNLSTETLYLAISYIDRFLSHMAVKRDKLQLVGTTAMFIASKYEEIYPPDVSQFAYITDNTYKVAHILRMEHLILKVLSFDMAVPTAFAFINQFARTLRCSEATTCLALFIAELTMLDCDPFLRFLPSEIAATALAIANYTQGHDPWPAVMVEHYGYTLDDLRECYVNLNRTFSKVPESSQHAIRDKYKTHKMHSASAVKPRTDLPF